MSIRVQRKMYHLPLEVLLSVLHDVKVSQVQVDVVLLSTVCCGYVPHHRKWPVQKDRPGCRHGFRV